MRIAQADCLIGHAREEKFTEMISRSLPPPRVLDRLHIHGQPIKVPRSSPHAEIAMKLLVDFVHYLSIISAALHPTSVSLLGAAFIKL